MRVAALLTIGLFLCVTGCSKAPQEKAVTLVNAAAVDAPLLERIRTFAEQELHVSVRTLEKPKLAGNKSFQALESKAKQVKTGTEPQHLAVYPASGMAIINTQPLYTDDAEKFARRLERQVMRAAAFSLGLTPTPDPFCVTRDYSSLEDLDSMGRNFSPPWQERFAEEAIKLGLQPR
jgi:hypothetical protein